MWSVSFHNIHIIPSHSVSFHIYTVCTCLDIQSMYWLLFVPSVLVIESRRKSCAYSTLQTRTRSQVNGAGQHLPRWTDAQVIACRNPTQSEISVPTLILPIWDHSVTLEQKWTKENASKQHTTLSIVVDAELIRTAPALFRRPLPETTPNLFQNVQRTGQKWKKPIEDQITTWNSELITNEY